MKRIFIIITISFFATNAFSQATNKIEPTGDVGIGTITPSSELHLKGINPIFYVESAITGQSKIQFDSLANKGFLCIKQAKTDIFFN